MSSRWLTAAEGSSSGDTCTQTFLSYRGERESLSQRSGFSPTDPYLLQSTHPTCPIGNLSPSRMTWCTSCTLYSTLLRPREPLYGRFSSALPFRSYSRVSRPHKVSSHTSSSLLKKLSVLFKPRCRLRIDIQCQITHYPNQFRRMMSW